MTYFYEIRKGKILHHFTINSQGRHSMCRASQVFQGSVEALTLDQAPFIESPELSYVKFLGVLLNEHLSWTYHLTGF